MAWAKQLGAHHVVDHSRPLADEVEKLGLGAPAFVFSTTNTDRHVGELAKLLAPQGRLALIDDPPTFDITLFKRKSVSIHWEFMFTRPSLQRRMSSASTSFWTRSRALVDAGRIRTTLAETFGPINAANLKRAHALIESGKARGKIVLEGF